MDGVDGSFLQWLVGQVGVGGLAGLALYLLDRSYRDALRREREIIEQQRADRKELITVLAEDARSRTSLQNTIENMTREWARISRITTGGGGNGD